jgi:hypothetical protein
MAKLILKKELTGKEIIRALVRSLALDNEKLQEFVGKNVNCDVEFKVPKSKQIDDMTALVEIFQPEPGDPERLKPKFDFEDEYDESKEEGKKEDGPWFLMGEIPLEEDKKDDEKEEE